MKIGTIVANLRQFGNFPTEKHLLINLQSGESIQPAYFLKIETGISSREDLVFFRSTIILRHSSGCTGDRKKLIEECGTKLGALRLLGGILDLRFSAKLAKCVLNISEITELSDIKS